MKAVGLFPFIGFTSDPGQALIPLAARGTEVDMATVNSLQAEL